MSHARLIFEDTPAFIPVPRELLHRKTEIIILPLEEVTTSPMTPVKSNKSVMHDEQGLNCYGERVIPGKQNFPDLSEFHKTLPKQEISASEFCRRMREEDRY